MAVFSIIRTQPANAVFPRIQLRLQNGDRCTFCRAYRPGLGFAGALPQICLLFAMLSLNNHLQVVFYLINIAGPLLICFLHLTLTNIFCTKNGSNNLFQTEGFILSICAILFTKEKNYVCIFAIVAKGSGWGGGSKPKVKMSIASATRRRRKIALI